MRVKKLLVFDQLYIDGVKYEPDRGSDVQTGQHRQQHQHCGNYSGYSTQMNVRDNQPSPHADLRGSRNPILANKFM